MHYAFQVLYPDKYSTILAACARATSRVTSRVTSGRGGSDASVTSGCDGSDRCDASAYGVNRSECQVSSAE